MKPPPPEAALAKWIELLAPNGRLVLVEGRWWTGAGLASSDVVELVLRHRHEAEVTFLTDASLWGAPVTDDRYVIISRS